MRKLLLALVLVASGSVASAGGPLPIEGHWVLDADATEAVVAKGEIEDPRRFSQFLGLGSSYLLALTYEFKGSEGRVILPRDPEVRGFHLVTSEPPTAVYEDDRTKARFTVAVIDADTISIAFAGSPEMSSARWKRGRRDGIRDAAQLEAVFRPWAAATRRMQAHLAPVPAPKQAEEAQQPDVGVTLHEAPQTRPIFHRPAPSTACRLEATPEGTTRTVCQ